MRPLVILFFVIGIALACENRWYMVPEQRVRFNKYDSLSAIYEPLKAQRDEWTRMWKEDDSKYDSLAPLIRRNSKEIDRILNEQEKILSEAEAYIDKFPTNRVLKKIF